MVKPMHVLYQKEDIDLCFELCNKFIQRKCTKSMDLQIHDHFFSFFFNVTIPHKKDNRGIPIALTFSGDRETYYINKRAKHVSRIINSIMYHAVS